jgi:hypothetical protein
METLSVGYQRERSDLESGDLTTLVIQALCAYTISAINGEAPSAWEWVLTTQEITHIAQLITRVNDGDPDCITNRRVGRVLGRMRLEKTHRPGGQGSHRWRVTLGGLERWTAAYGLPLPSSLISYTTSDRSGRVL